MFDGSCSVVPCPMMPAVLCRVVSDGSCSVVPCLMTSAVLCRVVSDGGCSVVPCLMTSAVLCRVVSDGGCSVVPCLMTSAVLCRVVSDGGCSVVPCLMTSAVLCRVVSDGSCSVMAAAAVCHGVVSAGVWICSCACRLLDHPSVSQSALSLPLFRRGVPACLSATLTRLGDSSRLALGRGVPLSQRRSEPADFSRPQPVTLRHSSGNQSPLCLSTYQFLVCHELTSNSIISSTSLGCSPGAGTWEARPTHPQL